MKCENCHFFIVKVKPTIFCRNIYRYYHRVVSNSYLTIIQHNKNKKLDFATALRGLKKKISKCNVFVISINLNFADT